QDRHRAGKIVDQNAFRDLELESPGVQSSLDQSLVDKPHDVVVAKLHRRQIDGNLQPVRPGRGFAARGTQDPFTHRDDQPVLFRERNEDSGATTPRLGWCQRTSASKPTIAPSILASGWKSRRRSSLTTADCRSCCNSCRSRNCAAMSASKNRIASRPSALAR